MESMKDFAIETKDFAIDIAKRFCRQCLATGDIHQQIDVDVTIPTIATNDEIKEMISEADRSTHKEGLIDFEDFYKVMKKNCDDPLGEFDSDEDDEGVY